jgi:PAS domain S-box-containing protein
MGDADFLGFRRVLDHPAESPTPAAAGVSGAAWRLLFPVIVFLAALPVAKWPLPAGWLAVMALLMVGDQRWRSGRSATGGLFSWFLSAGYSLAGLYFVLFYTGAPQTFGVTLYGVVMFQILARDYADRRRLLLNLTPPILGIVAAQTIAALGRISTGRPVEILTLLASPLIVFLVFRAVHDDLTRNRRLSSEANARAQASARRIKEAHRITLMAEEMAGVGHWSLDVASGVSVWSDAVYRIYGVPPDQGAPNLRVILAMHGSADREMVRRYIEQAIENGIPFTYEARIVKASGEVGYVMSSGAAERGADGKIVTVFGAFMDMTKVRLREKALRQSEARYRMLADHSTDVIIWANVGGDIRYASPSAKMLGYDPKDLAGHNIVEFIDPEDRARAIADLAEFFGGAPVDHQSRAEYQFTTGEGRTVWLESNGTLIRDDEGRVTSAVTSLRNVTARRRLEADLLEAKLHAEAAVEAKAEFLANMSHEIRTPLTGVIGFSGLLSDIADLPATARTYVQRIATSGRALLTVVNDILDFSKLEAGQVELDPQPFDVARFFDDTLAIFAGEAAAKRLDVRLEIEAGGPAALDADSARLRQVVTNLISNAIKFTDQGLIRVVVSFDADQGRLKVAVEDTGIGVSPDKLDRLFKRFSQVDGSVSRRHGGTGLGLSICKALVELMGGGISVVSKDRAGSTFSFWIAAATVPLVRIEDLPPPRLGLDSRPARILVVDDLDLNRELVRAILEATGHTVEEAASGAEAVQIAIGTMFDLILMDLQMPGMDGFAASRAIRNLASANRATPIIALSANVLPEHVEACAAAGMNDHIGKPVAPAELIGAVAHWTGGGAAEALDEARQDHG